MRAHEENTRKLAMLLQYREDYAERYQQGMTRGVDITHHVNFREFLGKLDEAIGGQQGLVEQTGRRLQHERDAWQEAERKRQSWTTLAGRAQQARLKQEQRREQKASDEHAAGMTRRSGDWRNESSGSDC